jgi:hypothetical protein
MNERLAIESGRDEVVEHHYEVTAKELRRLTQKWSTITDQLFLRWSAGREILGLLAVSNV